MKRSHITKWAGYVFAVTPAMVVIGLEKDGIVVGNFEVHTDGRILPTPPKGARGLLEEKAAGVRRRR